MFGSLGLPEGILTNLLFKNKLFIIFNCEYHVECFSFLYIIL